MSREEETTNTYRVRPHDQIVPISSSETKGGDGANDTEDVVGEDGVEFTAFIGAQQLQDPAATHDDLLRFGRREISRHTMEDGSGSL
jgi:hypothetical protein